MGKFGLSGAALKLLAVIAMTIDHVGFALFPQYPVFRIVGRLAFPIFAYMIGEGCRYTRNMGRYLLTVTGVALVCQVVYAVAMGSLYQSVLVSFAMAIALTAVVKYAQKKKNALSFLAVAAAIAAIYGITDYLPGLLSGTDFAVDYGFWGVMLPVLVYLGRSKAEKLLLCAFALVMLSHNPIQYLSLLAIPLLALYNGKRGKGLGKYFFYIYYPAHLVAIQAIAWFCA